MNKMRIIWVINVIMPEISEFFEQKSVCSVTWLDNMRSRIKTSCELVICSPMSGEKAVKKIEYNGVRYYGIPRKHCSGVKYEKDMKTFYKAIFEKERPNVIHVWGTEFPHTFSAVLAAEECGMSDRVVISIQGLVSVIEKHFMSTVPLWVQYLMVPKNFIRGFNLKQSQISYRKRGQYERQALSKIQHVIGRTEWDKACVTQINSELIYHKNNESLRQSFYEKQWKYETCEPFSIFLSQGGSPLKGMHLVLEAMELLKNKYPLIHLYVTGRNVLGKLSWSQKLALNPYDWYIRRMIRKKGLERKVVFLGSLNEEDMCSQYLKANVFVLASSIENSPNSLGEAMLLGVPSVAADVGGVSSMASPDEVYLYPHDEAYMLAYYICQVFDKMERAKERAVKAQDRAKRTHDAEENEKTLLHIYDQVCFAQNLTALDVM